MTRDRSTKRRARNSAKASFVVRNDRGIHTRPATELVRCSSNFKSLIHLRCSDMEVNAKSLLGVMTLAAGKGTKIQVEAVGPDAEEAVSAVLNLAENKFNICY